MYVNHFTWKKTNISIRYTQEKTNPTILLDILSKVFCLLLLTIRIVCRYERQRGKQKNY